MDAFTLAQLLDRRFRAGSPYLEFLRTPAPSLGLYVLDPGAVDGQRPHPEDEACVVLAGRGRFTAGSQTPDVGPEDAIFVPARVRTGSTTSRRRCGSSWRSRRRRVRGRPTRA